MRARELRWNAPLASTESPPMWGSVEGWDSPATGAVGAETAPVHEMIARLPFKTLVSAEWATLLEQALEEQGARRR